MFRSNAARTAALILLVAVVFGRVAAHEFVNFDDDKFLYANEKLLPPTAASLKSLWGEPHAHLYVPVTMTAWWCVAQAGLVRDNAAPSGFALNPWVFHLASLLVHVVNVLLVRRILRTMTRDDVAAVIGAAVFAIHPLQVETVAWASELKDLLAAMFSLLGISAAIEATRDDAKRRPAWWGGAIACFIAAMLSKPSAVTLPIVAAAVLWMIDATPRWRAIGLTLVVGLALAAPIMIATRHVQPAGDVPSPALWARPLVAVDAIAFYLGKTALPLWLGVDYGRTPAVILASRAAYWTWIAPVVVTVLVLLSRKRILIGAWLIFLAAPAANLGLLPFDFQVVSTVADHYAYVALLGVAIAVAWCISQWSRTSVPAIVAVLVLAILTFIQAGLWRDSHALWRQALAVNPNSGLAHVNLGALYLSDGNITEALPLLTRAAQIDPNDPFAHLNLIRAQIAAGQTESAAASAENLVAAYRRRADFDPQLLAAVLDRFAAAIAPRGDAASAKRLRDEAARLRNP